MGICLKPFGIYHGIEKIDDEADHNRQEHVRRHGVTSHKPVSGKLHQPDDPERECFTTFPPWWSEGRDAGLTGRSQARVQ
jgi:hypothetical protein